MNTKTIKIVMVILIMILSVTLFNPNVYARRHTAAEIVREGDSFISKGQNGTTIIDDENLKSMSDTLYNILLAIGIVIAVVVGGILGIKFMTGGLEGQADVKKSLIPFVAGCVVIFGAFTIWKIVLMVIQ